MEEEKIFWIFLIALGMIVWHILPDEPKKKGGK